jgi:predicted metal-dependent hydrolase
MARQASGRTTEAHRELSLDGRTVALRIRRHRQARRMNLRLDPKGGGVVLTLPPGTAERDGLAFVEEQAGWIATRLAAQPAVQTIADGAIIPLRGVDHRIEHRPGVRGAVWLENGRICVAGGAEHLPRRVVDWLKAEARRELARRSREKAKAIGRPVARVTVRDTTSRWASCSADGRLNYSWRLILAPDDVLDYVVAHEVAHLEELNHGPRFRALVDRLTVHRTAAEAWLRRHGARLHRYTDGR